MRKPIGTRSECVGESSVGINNLSTAQTLHKIFTYNPRVRSGDLLLPSMNIHLQKRMQ